MQKPSQFSNMQPGADDTLRKLDTLIWQIIAAIAAAVLLAVALLHFKLDLRSFLLPGAGLIMLMSAAWFYRARRPEARFAAALEGTAQMAAFTAVAAPLSYVVASIPLPLYDALFDDSDRAFGLDWMALLHWMNAHPLAHIILAAAYCSFLPQAAVMVVALAFAGELRRLRIFLLAFIFSTLVTIAISGALPAEGVWGFYKLTAADYPNIAPVAHGIHLPVFNGLRDGSLRLLMASGSEGIITFPSLHAALAVIFALAFWPIRYLRWLGVIVNLLMIAATPIEGGHYFIDVIAGIAIAFACWAVTVKIATHTRKRIPALQAPHLIPGE